MPYMFKLGRMLTFFRNCKNIIKLSVNVPKNSTVMIVQKENVQTIAVVMVSVIFRLEAVYVKVLIKYVF